MKPAGVILTFIDWRKVKNWWFNIPLLIGQLAFMIVGTAYGKVKWPQRSSTWRDAFILWLFLIPYWIIPTWWNIPVVIAWLFTVVAILCGIPWRRVWRAAQVSHVRLCLQPTIRGHWEYINFGADGAKIEVWRMGQVIDNKRFRYFRPTFEPSDEFAAAMIECANKMVKDPVARKYDWLQLALGYVVNFAIWVFCPWLWGKEVVPWFNLPGGLEVCISGLVACLRWGEYDELRGAERWNMLVTSTTRFFKGYSTAVVWPCLVPLSKNWEER